MQQLPTTPLSSTLQGLNAWECSLFRWFARQLPRHSLYVADFRAYYVEQSIAYRTEGTRYIRIEMLFAQVLAGIEQLGMRVYRADTWVRPYIMHLLYSSARLRRRVIVAVK